MSSGWMLQEVVLSICALYYHGSPDHIFFHAGSLGSMINGMKEPQTIAQLNLHISLLTVDQCPLNAYAA